MVGGSLESSLLSLLAVWSRGQQHLHVVPGTAGRLQAHDQAVLQDKTEISIVIMIMIMIMIVIMIMIIIMIMIVTTAHLGIIEAELCLMTMNSR